MRRLKASLVIGLAVVALFVVSSALPAGSQQPAPRSTITLFDPDRTEWDKFIDNGREDFSPGDEILFLERQLDAETCEPRGVLVGHLIVSKFVGKNNAWFIGDFTLKLPDGKITAYGGAKFADFALLDKGLFAVTGGTDAYRDASGEVNIQEDITRCDKRGALITLDVGPQP